MAAGEEGEAEVNGPRDDACSESALVWRLGLVEPSPAPVLEEPEEGRWSRCGWRKRSLVGKPTPCSGGEEADGRDLRGAGASADARLPGEGEGGGAVMPVGLG